MSPSCRSCGSSSESDGSDCRLLHEIEAIGRALHLRRPLVSSIEITKSEILRKGLGLEPGVDDGGGGDASESGKSRSAWSWKKPLEALSRIRNRKFPCIFFLHVHSIEGLPDSFDDRNLCVEFVRKDEALRTRPSRVLGGTVDFDDTLIHRCTVYCHKMNGAYDCCKYEPKLFVVRVYISESPGLDLGKHRVDLTRLLPISFEELDGEKSSGKWTTRFKLAREAMGGVLNVSFGFMMGARSILESSGILTVSELISMSYSNAGSRTDGRKPFGGLRCSGSIPGGFLPESTDSTGCYEALVNPSLELSRSIHLVCQKLDEDRSATMFTLSMEDVDRIEGKDDSGVDAVKMNGNDACYEMEYVVIDRGIEVAKKEVPDSVKGDDYNGPGTEGLSLDGIITNLSLGVADNRAGSGFLDVHGNERPSVGWSLDEDDPESPRERLLREFQEEALALGNFVISFDSAGEEKEGGSDRGDLVLASDSWADTEDSTIASVEWCSGHLPDASSRSLKLRIKLKMPDDLEAEDFRNSRQRDDPSGFGSPVEVELPSGSSTPLSF